MVDRKDIRFYIRDTKRFLQCIQLFRGESEILLTMSPQKKELSLFSLIQSSIAVLQIVLIQGPSKVSILVDTPSTDSSIKEDDDILFYLDTKTFVKAMSEMLRFGSHYCILQPSSNGEQLICTAMDINNREVVCHRIHCNNESADSNVTSIERPDNISSIIVKSTGKTLGEYFATGEDTQISCDSSLRRLIWTINDTLLNTRRFLFLSESDIIPNEKQYLNQTYTKQIMSLARNILVFMCHDSCTIALSQDLPLHIFNNNIDGMRVDFLAGHKEDIID
jgi:hypothetical protein